MGRSNKSTFKADDGRPKGRPKGLKNKRTLLMEENFILIMDLIHQRLTNYEDVISRLSPANLAKLYVDLIGYLKPKLTKNDINANNIKIEVSHCDNDNLNNDEEEDDDDEDN
jgi:hypothetical protein